MPGMQRAVGRNRAELFRKAGRLFVRAALWSGEFCAGWPRPCPPPHAAFRTLCPQTRQSVRSEAHYAAAVPRRARPALGGGPGKAGRSAALPCRRSLCPGDAVGRGSLAQDGRGPVRRRTRRFGHFALKPGKVFAPRRTTRRQCRAGLSRHRAAGQAKRGESAALPCRAALPAPFFRPHFPGLPRLRPADPRGPLRAPRAKTGKIRLFCDISAFVNRICF